MRQSCEDGRVGVSNRMPQAQPLRFKRPAPVCGGTQVIRGGFFAPRVDLDEHQEMIWQAVTSDCVEAPAIVVTRIKASKCTNAEPEMLQARRREMRDSEFSIR